MAELDDRDRRNAARLEMMTGMQNIDRENEIKMRRGIEQGLRAEVFTLSSMLSKSLLVLEFCLKKNENDFEKLTIDEWATIAMHIESRS